MTWGASLASNEKNDTEKYLLQSICCKVFVVLYPHHPSSFCSTKPNPTALLPIEAFLRVFFKEDKRLSN